MNYFLLIIILALCGGGYYEHTLEQQKSEADRQQISDQAAKISSLEAQVQTLTDAKTQAQKSSSDASATVPGSTAQPVTTANSGAVAPATTPGTISSVPAVTTPLTKDQMVRGVVIIKGDKAEGTGFLVRTADGPAVVTNIHVISNNPNLKITTNTGIEITPLGLKGAIDRDLAMFAIQDANYTYLPLATNLTTMVQVGDEVITPGNSQGGGTVLTTTGKIIGIGPDRIEFSNPIYHGNSGGPVFHTKSGTVLAVVAEAMKVDITNDLDKTSFQSRNSAITGPQRYFGLRLDTVPKWETYDQRRFLNETIFLSQFDAANRCLDSYLNSGNASGDDTKLYLTNPKIVTANDNFLQGIGGGAGASQRIDAARQFVFELTAVADDDVPSIQNLNNFYSFDQQQAKDELAYRKALRTEIDAIANDVTRLGSVPRKSN